jgi:hypothetical protein
MGRKSVSLILIGLVGWLRRLRSGHRLAPAPAPVKAIAGAWPGRAILIADCKAAHHAHARSGIASVRD